jgi:hypothetical protein
MMYRVRASEIRLGDRLVREADQPPRAVIQVKHHGGETVVSHGIDESRFFGNPWVQVLRAAPRIDSDDSLPAAFGPRRTARRTLPWEGSD